MSVWSRIKSLMGGDRVGYIVPAATTTIVPDNTNLVYLTGTATITALKGAPYTRNRIVQFIQSDSGATTFTNDDTPGANEMDLGGSNIVLAQADALTLLLRADGSWLRVGYQDN